MKTILKCAVAVAAVILIGFAADYVYQAVTGIRADLTALKVTDERAFALIAEKEAANAALLEANVALRERDAASQVERAVLRRERDIARADLAEALEELKTAPPEKLVARASTLLGTDGITLAGDGVAFTLPAFRLDVGALEEWHALKFTLVPNLERDLELASGQAIALRTMVQNLGVIVSNKDDVIAAKDEQLDARDEVIKQVKKRRLWEKVAYALSFVAGYIIGK